MPTEKRTALYLEIAESLRREILSKALPPHTRLPSEPELVRRFTAARATVRRALAALQDEGLVYSRRAIGSFVAEPRIAQDLDQLVSFTEFMVYRGLKPGAKVIAAEIQRIDDPQSPILRHLRLRAGARVCYIRRLRLGGQQPLVIANTWLSAARFPRLLRQDLGRASIYELLGAAGYKLTDAVQTMEAVTLDAEQAELLTVTPGASALLIRRVGYASGVPVEYAVDYYRGDRTRFRVRLGLLEQRLDDRHDGDHLSI